MARINIAHGSVRSGKTVGLEEWRWMQFVRQAPKGAPLLMSGRTLKALERNTLRPMQTLFGSRLVQFSISSKTATIAGKKVDLEGANDEQAQAKIQGMTLYGSLCNELSLFPESFFRQLLARLSLPNAKLFATTNPDSPYHWLKKDFLDRGDELNLRQWHFTLDDNPFLDPDYVTALKAEYSGVWYKRMVSGLWVLAEGVIYDCFDENRHAVKPSTIEIDPNTYWAAVDYGTRNAFSLGLYAREKYHAVLPISRVFKVGEWYFDSVVEGHQKTDEQYADALVDFIGARSLQALYVDPSAASFIQVLENRRLPVQPAANAVLDGIRSVSTALQQERLLVSADCKHTIRQFQSYSWDPRAQLRGEDKPLKVNDHAMDETRYAYYTHIGMPRDLAGIGWGEIY